MFEERHAIQSYWQTRRLRGAAQLDAIKRRRLDIWLKRDLPRVRFYEPFAGLALSDLPVVDKSVLMADFAAFNTVGLTAEMGWRAFEADKTFGRYIVGASTGTSGNRGLFVISQAERFRWLGTILAKALPDFWRMNLRVAILLPVNTPLYESANRLRRLTLRFFDVASDWDQPLHDFRPDVIVAPPKVLRKLAEDNSPLRPRKLYSGAEKLDRVDRDVIEAWSGLQLGQIYMATEGLFAVTCARGTLHLCEERMHFELPTVTDDPNLRELIITDFSRQTQIMARYRMNDLVRLRDDACPCGAPQTALAEVIGRQDDCFRIGPNKVLFTPDVIRNAVVDADRRIRDFRVVQTGAAEVVLQVDVALEAAARALRAVFARKGVVVNVVLGGAVIKVPMDRKLRRVENRFAG